jgi:hypothetical protein
VEQVLTASAVRAMTARIVARMNAPLDLEAEKRYKREWNRRIDMMLRGELEVHPFVGLMANYKDENAR